MWSGICGSLVRELFAVLWKACAFNNMESKEEKQLSDKTLTLLENVITSFDILKKNVSGQIS